METDSNLRARQTARLLDGILDDVGDLATLGSALAKSQVAAAFAPFKRVIASLVVATVLGFAGLLDLIRLAVAFALRDDLSGSRPWLGWSAFALLALSGLIGYFGTRRKVTVKAPRAAKPGIGAMPLETI